MTSAEVKAYQQHSAGIILPVGSIEQHGATGLVGTDTLCAQAIAKRAGEMATAIVAPALAYSPAQFNMGFAGTLSVSSRVFSLYFEEIIRSLHAQKFQRVYVVNAHGANLAALQSSVHDVYARYGSEGPLIRIKSWWEFEQVAALRTRLYGEREGIHATPSEVAITQYLERVVDVEAPPDYRKLEEGLLKAHQGDRHLPATLHRRQFPDGQIGSDPRLARPEHGRQLLELAATCITEDYTAFVQSQC